MNVYTTEDELVNIYNENSINLYHKWSSADTIISDGAYGVGGFEGDPKTPHTLPKIYEEHVKLWYEFSKPNATLWFWNTEIGWALVHPILDKFGWDYKCSYTWNKGLNHAAGNSNTKTLSHLPKVTEVCVQYVKRPYFKDNTGNNLIMKDWLRYEWKRAGLPFNKTNEVCEVKNAASRKYFTDDYHWYMMPGSAFEKIALYANEFGNKDGRPYFSKDGKKIMSKDEWEDFRPKFKCKLGVTNVWDCGALRGKERLKIGNKSKHLNQKPLELMKLIIELSTDENDIIWEPFGGLCSATLAAKQLGRRAFAAEIDRNIYDTAVTRF